MSRSEAKNIVVKYAKKLKSSGYPYSEIYLFGSQIKGTAREYSDIDVAVVSERISEDYDKGRFDLWELRRDVDINIEPHGFSPEDFKRNSNPLVFEIKTTGERIV